MNERTNKQTNRQTDKQTNRQTDKQTDRQTDRDRKKDADKGGGGKRRDDGEIVTSRKSEAEEFPCLDCELFRCVGSLNLIQPHGRYGGYVMKK